MSASKGRPGAWSRAAVILAVAVGLVFASVIGGQRLLLEAPRIPPNAAADSVVVRVPSGESFHSLARRLERERLVRSALCFRILARLEGADRSIRVGTYVFARGTGPARILKDLVEGNVLRHRLTIPEGWRLDEIAGEVERVLSIPKEELRAAASDTARVRAVGARSENLEGYLFPETYFFADGSGASEVVDALIARFETNWQRATADVDSIPLGLDRHQVVTLASIVEAETGLPDERSRIAAVYLNRLAHGWKLQADPTVRFALGKYDGDVLYRDLEIESAYNTYRTAGLPPGPIGSPGFASLHAATHPLASCEDFYFVASGAGGHVFSKTLRDHDRAKQAAKFANARREGG